jgi:hypothetical protein
LKDWIYNARLANIEVNDKELQVAIKGDAKKKNIHHSTSDGYVTRSKKSIALV